MLPVALHARVRQEQEKAGMTLGEYVEAMITEYYDWKDGKIMTGEMRTLAAQIPAELFERLDRYLKERGIKKKDFLVDIITRALEPLKRYRLRLDMLDGIEITYRVQQPESNHPFYLLYTEITLTYYDGIKSWAITRLRHRTQHTGPKGEFITATFRNPKKIPIQVLKAFTRLKL